MTKDLSVGSYVDNFIYLIFNVFLQSLTLYRLDHLITHYVMQVGQEITKSFDLKLPSPRINIMLSCAARNKYREYTSKISKWMFINT